MNEPDIDPLDLGESSLPPYQDDSPGLLPTYSIGSSVSSRRSSETGIDASVELSVLLDESLAKIRYSQGCVVAGRVVFCPRSSVQINRIDIELIHIEEILCVNYYAGNRVRRIVALAESVLSPTAYPDNMIFDHELVYSFNFALQFPDLLPGGRTGIKLHDILPPSFGMASLPGHKSKELTTDIVSDSTVRMNYAVRTSIYTEGQPHKVWKSAVQFVQFSPRPVLTQIMDYKTFTPTFQSSGTYIARSVLTSPLLCLSIRRRSPSSEILLELNNPITTLKLIRGSGSHGGNYLPISSSLDLHVYMHVDSPDLPPRNLVRITNKLIAHTLSSHAFIKKFPVPGEGDKIHTNTEVLSRNKLDSPSPVWTAKDRGKYGTILRIPLFFQPDEKFIPTFFASLSSRQYELVVQLDFQRSNSVEIRVPIILHH